METQSAQIGSSTPPIPSPTSTNLSPKDRVQKYIDETLAAALDQLSFAEGQPLIKLKRRGKRGSYYINPQNGALEAAEVEKYATYSWPGKDAYEAWKFAVAMRTLSAIAEALNTGLVISKRDIYYSDPVCFGSQRVVDNLIDDFAHTIGVDRSALNVEAAAKGLVIGYYQLTTTLNEVIDARPSTKDSLVPRAQDIDMIDISDVSWVLILEKEAIYRRLARSSYHLRAATGKGILVTGKGYPDIGTRAFLRKVLETSIQSNTSIPRFYALVDNDPDGMAIMSTYKYGSMAHATNNGRLNIPSLCWLGVRTSDVAGGGTDDISNAEEALIQLTRRDRRKIIAMLSNNPVWAHDGPEQEWRTELQRMLMLNVKAETEILYDRDGGLEGWVDQQMQRLQ